MVENLLAMQETQVHSLGWEDPLKKEMAIHSNILFFSIYFYLLEANYFTIS